jgi:hypothetical protein
MPSKPQKKEVLEEKKAPSPIEYSTSSYKINSACALKN